jgi:hypothetical protein
MWTFGTKYFELTLILSSLKWLGMPGDHFEGNEPSQIAAHLIPAETDSHSGLWQLACAQRARQERCTEYGPPYWRR